MANYPGPNWDYENNRPLAPSDAVFKKEAQSKIVEKIARKLLGFKVRDLALQGITLHEKYVDENWHYLVRDAEEIFVIFDEVESTQ